MEYICGVHMGYGMPYTDKLLYSTQLEKKKKKPWRRVDPAFYSTVCVTWVVKFGGWVRCMDVNVMVG